MTDIKYIKQEVNIKGRSYSEVAKQMEKIQELFRNMQIKRTGTNQSTSKYEKGGNGFRKANYRSMA